MMENDRIETVQETEETLNHSTEMSPQTNKLNEALIQSKPISVLDELENYWERNDANRGQARGGILAEHIMERQAQELLNGGEGEGKAKGKGAFCVM